MLSCSCDEWDGEGVAKYSPSKFSTLETKKRKRCKSCNVLINIGADCLIFNRVRMADYDNDIEMRIYGEDQEIPMASHYLCEKCGEKYLNLEALGYCLDISESMDTYMAEYHDMTGFKQPE